MPAQREINRRTAKAYGLTIVKSIEIVDVSGTAVLASPQMQELLRLMESPDIHGVVTKEFSRLMRPEKFTDYALLQQFIDTCTVLYLPDGPLDLASKSSRLLGTIRAAIAGLERREIIEQHERREGIGESARRAGKHPGGDSTLPFGIAYSPKGGSILHRRFGESAGGVSFVSRRRDQLHRPLEQTEHSEDQCPFHPRKSHLHRLAESV